MGQHGGAVADREDAFVAGGAQGGLDREEAPLVERQAGAREPGRGAGFRDDENVVGLQPLAAVETDGAALYRRGRCVLEQADAAPRQGGAYGTACGDGIAGQDFAAGDERDFDPGGGCDRAQAMIDRQRQLDAARAAPDHRDVQGLAPARHARDEGEPAAAEFGDRLHRRGVLGRAGDRRQAGRGADVERQEIVGDGRPVLQQHLAIDAIEPDRFGLDQARAGPRRHARKVDVAFVEGIVAGDEARDHAGVGGLDVAPDQRQADAGHRLHAEALQHMDVGMAAADQHEILE